MTACRERDACWGSVELMRDSDDRAFNEDEIRLLDDLAPALGTPLRRSLALSWRRDAEHSEVPPPGTLIPNHELAPAGWTSPARDWLEPLQPCPGMLPPAVYEIGARLLASDSSDAVRPLPARVRLRTPSGRWTVIEGTRLEGGDEGRVAIIVRAAMGGEILDLLCRAHGLTPRERELVDLLRGGLATERVSDELWISRYTMQDHLKAIFDKTGVRSRRELISHLVGSTRSPVSADRPNTPTRSRGSPRRR